MAVGNVRLTGKPAELRREPKSALGGALVATASVAVLKSELRDGDTKLAGTRALMLLAGLSALVAHGD